MEQLQTFRRQHTPGAATHTPQLARATSEAGGGHRRPGCATPARGFRELPRQTRAAPLPRNRPERGAARRGEPGASASPPRWPEGGRGSGTCKDTAGEAR